MKTAVLKAPGRFEIIERDCPAVPVDWIKIRVAFCGICGSDLAIFDRDPPIPHYWPGHEISGFVDNRLVTVNPLLACGSCGQCTNGREAICPNAKMISHHMPGGFAEYVYAPQTNIVPMQVSPEAATLAEPLAACVHAIRRAGNIQGKSVRIIGGGTAGLLLLQLAHIGKAGAVEVSAKYPHQQNAASQAGAAPLPGPADITFLAAGGDGSALQQAVDHSLGGSKIIMMANVYHSRPLNFKWLVERELTMVGSQRYSPTEFQEAGRLINTRAIQTDGLITHTFPLDEIMQAYAVAAGKSLNGSIKVVLKMGAES